ncbi:hypothetical protein Mtc_0915 [Methanocella conradii HZ254]|uniref:DUF5320 domain-containing protein n=1 Tax=Methanocella conradii (strain DSM 24694 / JCM 17849 / CGMCC 1.5162 / HZ254) TaxID=1041930 RepID=H8I4B8_METCZ|nr:DUF5320 domain-containing protein [Methanocella conradii]AFC99675.1 hypothetical protein Mtc_0915 [Methanocella conradii HZ254]
MPGLDGTGPLGMGPMTGRGMGYCTGYVPAQGRWLFGRGAGRGFFCGRGRGRGWRNMYYATGLTGWQRAAAYWPGVYWPAVEPTREQELEALKRQSEFFERSLEEVRKRIEELESKPQKE